VITRKVLVGLLACAFVLIPGLALGYGYVNPIYKVSPITNAKWVKIDFQNGVSFRDWYTDQGIIFTDVPAFIQQGRTYIPFRWALEALGGWAEWSSYPDGTTQSVTFHAPEPEVVTNTVTETVTVTNTVTQTVTVTIPVYPAPSLKLVGSPTVFAGVDIDKNFWGFYKPNDIAMFWLQYPNGTGRFINVLCDSIGYFEGNLVFNPNAPDFQAGDWTLSLLPGPLNAICVTIHVIAPETTP